MSLPDRRTRAETEMLRRRASLARERAAQCAARAFVLEARLLTDGPSRQMSHDRMRSLLLRAVSRHLISAQMHELLAARMEAWRSGTEPASGPGLMAAIADQLGTASALATLGRKRAVLAMVAVSDKTARAAHELELVMGEGPATEASGGAQVTAAGADILDRWPHYGPAVAELGIHAVCATPLGPPRAGIGALCAYDTVTAAPERTATATKLMAEALTQMLLATAPDEELTILGFLDASDSQSVVQQAVGMVSVQCGCRPREAADLVAARAFADSTSVPEVARQIVRGEVQF